MIIVSKSRFLLILISYLLHFYFLMLLLTATVITTEHSADNKTLAWWEVLGYVDVAAPLQLMVSLASLPGQQSMHSVCVAKLKQRSSKQHFPFETGFEQLHCSDSSPPPSDASTETFLVMISYPSFQTGCFSVMILKTCWEEAVLYCRRWRQCKRYCYEHCRD